MHRKALCAASAAASERRRETRLLCSDLVTVQWPDAAGMERKEFGVLENVAPGGASLLVGVPLPAGVAVRISAPPASFTGIARHCCYVTNGYLVGVEFDDSSRWSHEAYAPEHLLDPCLLEDV